MLEIYASPEGNDSDIGTIDSPFASPQRALRAVREYGREREGVVATIYLRGGTYYLGDPLVFTPEDSGYPENPVTMRPYRNEFVTFHGGV